MTKAAVSAGAAGAADGGGAPEHAQAVAFAMPAVPRSVHVGPEFATTQPGA